MLTNGESANSREGPTAETSRPLSPDDDHQLLFDQIATATERCELVSRRAQRRHPETSEPARRVDVADFRFNPHVHGAAHSVANLCGPASRYRAGSRSEDEDIRPIRRRSRKGKRRKVDGRLDHSRFT